MEIEEIKSIILNEYTDRYGRVTLNPAKGSQTIPGSWDSENQLLFTGEYAKLLHLLGALDAATAYRLFSAVQSCLIVPGLYNRHPRFTERTLSHDELNGLMYLASSHRDLRIIAEQVYEYGRNHNFAYINENPGADGYKLSGKGCPDQDGKKSRDILPYVHRIKQPRDIGFYKLITKEVKGAEVKPSTFELLNMSAAAIMSSRADKAETSGKIMWWFKLRSVDVNSSSILKLTNKVFMSNLKKQYGEQPLKEMLKIYFHKDHPFHLLAELLGE